MRSSDPRQARWSSSILICLLAACTLVPAAAQADKRVALVYADSTNHTLRTISGIKWSLNKSSPQSEIEECYLRDLQPLEAEKVRAMKPDAVVTIGTSATSLATTHLSEIPVVFAKVLNPIESGFIKSWDDPGNGITGAALDIPADQQVMQFQSILPGLRRVGMIFTSQTARLRDEAAEACRKYGLELISIEILTTRELPAALDSLCKVVDGIWTIADETLSSPQFVRYIVMETMRQGIPIMGFNRNFVQNGALLCLEADYKFIGRQAGDIAARILNGEAPASIRPTVPDIVYLYLNLKSSKLLEIQMSPEWIGVARETF